MPLVNQLANKLNQESFVRCYLVLCYWLGNHFESHLINQLVMYKTYKLDYLHSRNRCCRRKAVLHILSVLVVLVIQHAKRMRRIILSSVVCLSGCKI